MFITHTQSYKLKTCQPANRQKKNQSKSCGIYLSTGCCCCDFSTLSPLLYHIDAFCACLSLLSPF